MRDFKKKGYRGNRRGYSAGPNNFSGRSHYSYGGAGSNSNENVNYPIQPSTSFSRGIPSWNQQLQPRPFIWQRPFYPNSLTQFQQPRPLLLRPPLLPVQPLQSTLSPHPPPLLPTPPLPGSEEARQRAIAEASARIKEQLNLSGESSIGASQVAKPPPAESPPHEVSTPPKGGAKRKPKRFTSLSTANVENLRHRILSHMSKGKIQNLVNNAGSSRYDVALQHLIRDMRLHLSSELRSMYNNRETQDEAIIDHFNSIVPDLGVELVSLPDTMVAELSKILQLDVTNDSGCLDDDLTLVEPESMLVEPESMFKEAERMLSESNLTEENLNVIRPLNEVEVSNLFDERPCNTDKNLSFNEVKDIDFSLDENIFTNFSFNQNISSTSAENANRNISTSIPMNQKILSTSFPLNQNIPTNFSFDQSIPSTGFLPNQNISSKIPFAQNNSGSFSLDQNIPTSFSLDQTTSTNFPLNKNTPTSFSIAQKMAPKSFLLNQSVSPNTSVDSIVPAINLSQGITSSFSLNESIIASNCSVNENISLDQNITLVKLNEKFSNTSLDIQTSTAQLNKKSSSQNTSLLNPTTLRPLSHTVTSPHESFRINEKPSSTETNLLKLPSPRTSFDSSNVGMDSSVRIAREETTGSTNLLKVEEKVSCSTEMADSRKKASDTPNFGVAADESSADLKVLNSAKLLSNQPLKMSSCSSVTDNQRGTDTKAFLNLNTVKLDKKPSSIELLRFLNQTIRNGKLDSPNSTFLLKEALNLLLPQKLEPQNEVVQNKSDPPSEKKPTSNFTWNQNKSYLQKPEKTPENVEDNSTTSSSESKGVFDLESVFLTKPFTRRSSSAPRESQSSDQKSAQELKVKTEDNAENVKKEDLSPRRLPLDERIKQMITDKAKYDGCDNNKSRHSCLKKSKHKLKLDSYKNVSKSKLDDKNVWLTKKMRAYRQRQKEKQIIKFLSVVEVPSDDFDKSESEHIKSAASDDFSTMDNLIPKENANISSTFSTLSETVKKSTIPSNTLNTDPNKSESPLPIENDANRPKNISNKIVNVFLKDRSNNLSDSIKEVNLSENLTNITKIEKSEVSKKEFETNQSTSEKLTNKTPNDTIVGCKFGQYINPVVSMEILKKTASTNQNISSEQATPMETLRSPETNTNSETYRNISPGKSTMKEMIRIPIKRNVNCTTDLTRSPENLKDSLNKSNVKHKTEQITSSEDSSVLNANVEITQSLSTDCLKISKELLSDKSGCETLKTSEEKVFLKLTRSDANNKIDQNKSLEISKVSKEVSSDNISCKTLEDSEQIMIKSTISNASNKTDQNISLESSKAVLSDKSKLHAGKKIDQNVKSEGITVSKEVLINKPSCSSIKPSVEVVVKSTVSDANKKTDQNLCSERTKETLSHISDKPDATFEMSQDLERKSPARSDTNNKTDQNTNFKKTEDVKDVLDKSSCEIIKISKKTLSKPLTKSKVSGKTDGEISESSKTAEKLLSEVPSSKTNKVSKEIMNSLSVQSRPNHNYEIDKSFYKEHDVSEEIYKASLETNTTNLDDVKVISLKETKKLDESTKASSESNNTDLDVNKNKNINFKNCEKLEEMQKVSDETNSTDLKENSAKLKELTETTETVVVCETTQDESSEKSETLNINCKTGEERKKFEESRIGLNNETIDASSYKTDYVTKKSQEVLEKKSLETDINCVNCENLNSESKEKIINSDIQNIIELKASVILGNKDQDHSGSIANSLASNLNENKLSKKETHHQHITKAKTESQTKNKKPVVDHCRSTITHETKRKTSELEKKDSNQNIKKPKLTKDFLNEPLQRNVLNVQEQTQNNEREIILKRMLVIDTEIQNLMKEKWSLYKQLQMITDVEINDMSKTTNADKSQSVTNATPQLKQQNDNRNRSSPAKKRLQQKEIYKKQYKKDSKPINKELTEKIVEKEHNKDVDITSKSLTEKIDTKKRVEILDKMEKQHKQNAKQPKSDTDAQHKRDIKNTGKELVEDKPLKSDTESNMKVLDKEFKKNVECTDIESTEKANKKHFKKDRESLEKTGKQSKKYKISNKDSIECLERDGKQPEKNGHSDERSMEKPNKKHPKKDKETMHKKRLKKDAEISNKKLVEDEKHIKKKVEDNVKKVTSINTDTETDHVNLKHFAFLNKNLQPSVSLYDLNYYKTTDWMFKTNSKNTKDELKKIDDDSNDLHSQKTSKLEANQKNSERVLEQFSEDDSCDVLIKNQPSSVPFDHLTSDTESTLGKNRKISRKTDKYTDEYDSDDSVTKNLSTSMSLDLTSDVAPKHKRNRKNSKRVLNKSSEDDSDEELNKNRSSSVENLTSDTSSTYKKNLKNTEKDDFVNVLNKNRTLSVSSENLLSDVRSIHKKTLKISRSSKEIDSDDESNKNRPPSTSLHDFTADNGSAHKRVRNNSINLLGKISEDDSDGMLSKTRTLSISLDDMASDSGSTHKKKPKKKTSDDDSDDEIRQSLVSLRELNYQKTSIRKKKRRSLNKKKINEDNSDYEFQLKRKRKRFTSESDDSRAQSVSKESAISDFETRSYCSTSSLKHLRPTSSCSVTSLPIEMFTVPCFVQLERITLPKPEKNEPPVKTDTSDISLSNLKIHVPKKDSCVAEVSTTSLNVQKCASSGVEEMDKHTPNVDTCLGCDVEDVNEVNNYETIGEEGVFCMGHKKSILDIKIIGNEFLAASEDGTIYKYCLETGNLQDAYTGHKRAVTCMYVTPGAVLDIDALLLYSGSLDCTLNCFNIDTAEVIHNVHMEQPIQCLDSAWGFIFLGTYEGLLFIYNIKKKLLHAHSLTVASATVLALKTTQEGGCQMLIVASRKREIVVRNAFTGLLLRTMYQDQKPTIYSLFLNKNFLYCGTSDRGILVVDFYNGREETVYECGRGVVCMVMQGPFLFAGCYDGLIYVYDTRVGEQIAILPGPGEGMLLSLAINKHLLIASTKKDHLLKIWKIPTNITMKHCTL